MKTKNISTQSGKLLAHFNELERHYFDFKEAEKVLPNSSKSALKELLSNMVKRGLLLRIKRGTYWLIPYERDPQNFIPNWHLLAEVLTKGVQHYVGYYSALQVYSLITQPSLNEQIVVAKQIRPSRITIQGIPFHFIYHNHQHFFGNKGVWIDGFNKVQCSNLEKTIIDCLFKPDYAGGIALIGLALYTSRDEINYNLLLDYAIRFKSQSVIKRLGFLLELFGIGTEIISKLNNLKTSSYTLLDTVLPKSGKMISRWSIQQNLDTETILSTLEY